MKEFMQKFDKNKDGRIEMSEVRPQRTSLFYRFYLTEQLDCLGNMHFLLSFPDLDEKIDTKRLYAASQFSLA